MTLVECKCGGKGVYVITPEEAGYHRAITLDRRRKTTLPPGMSPDDFNASMITVSTAYVNERGDVYHFARNDPGGFGRRCEVHGALSEGNLNR